MTGYLCQNLLQIFLAAVIVINIYVANATYLNLHLRYENAYHFYSSLLADLQMMPEYNEDTNIAILGHYPEPDFYWDEFPFTYGMYGASGFNPDTYTRWEFLYYYLGQRVGLPSEAQIAEIQASEEYAQMPLYPYYGSMRFFGDTLVVKLSN